MRRSCIVRKTASTVYHAAATRAMGMANDIIAVVDSKVRAFGVEGLRVVFRSYPQGTRWQRCVGGFR